jgi:hypothetical protein
MLMKRGIYMYRYENHPPMAPMEPPYRYGAPGIDPLTSGLLGAGLGFLGGSLLTGGPGFLGVGPGYGPGYGGVYGPGYVGFPAGAYGPGYGAPYGPGFTYGPFGY